MKGSKGKGLRVQKKLLNNEDWESIRTLNQHDQNYLNPQFSSINIENDWDIYCLNKELNIYLRELEWSCTQKSHLPWLILIKFTKVESIKHFINATETNTT